jgi:hypothetical protein
MLKTGQQQKHTHLDRVDAYVKYELAVENVSGEHTRQDQLPGDAEVPFVKLLESRQFRGCREEAWHHRRERENVYRR